MTNKTKTKRETKKNKKPEKRVKLQILIPLICVCLVVAIIISVISISSNKRTPAAYTFDKEIAQGVDISEHNGKVDWDKLADEFDFAFIRVGYRGYGNGKIYEDKYARKNLKAANKAGIPIGVYFYTQATTEREAEKEASFVADIIRRYDIQLPVMIDFEYPCDKNGNHVGRLVESNLTSDESADIINAFLEKAQDKGYNCGVYASSSVFAMKIKSSKLNRNAVLWVADYNSKVTYKVDYDIWQYTEKGKSDAVSSKYVDLNYWFSQ